MKNALLGTAVAGVIGKTHAQIIDSSIFYNMTSTFIDINEIRRSIKAEIINLFHKSHIKMNI